MSQDYVPVKPIHPTDQEVWVKVSFAPDYLVSNFCRVKRQAFKDDLGRHHKERILKPIFIGSRRKTRKSYFQMRVNGRIVKIYMTKLLLDGVILDGRENGFNWLTIIDNEKPISLQNLGWAKCPSRASR